MFSGLIAEERQTFLSRSYDCFIPGYTGHCPTLKFHYGTGYGTKTREILKDIRSKTFYQDAQKNVYRPQDRSKSILQPVSRSKGQFRDYSMDYKYHAPRYITGYTGFIPTMNFRYGKSYSRAADDSVCEYTNNQRRIREAEAEVDKIFRAKSAPRTASIRSKDEVDRAMSDYVNKTKYKNHHELSPENPPITGYTGHIPRVKGNEVSLSQRYHTAVKRSLTILKDERDKRKHFKSVQNKIDNVMESVGGMCPIKK